MTIEVLKKMLDSHPDHKEVEVFIEIQMADNVYVRQRATGLCMEFSGDAVGCVIMGESGS